MDIKINGIESVKEVLNKLDTPLKNKIIKKALQLLAKPILETAKSKIWTHQRKGRLYRSLGQKDSSERDQIKLLLGARKTGKYKGWAAHFLENGTTNRSYTTKNGVKHNTGKATGIYFWSSSIEETITKSENEYYNYIIDSIDKEINSIIRKVNK